jgi:hypothetical protein
LTLVIALSVLQLATIQKPVPDPAPRCPVTLPRATLVPPAPETDQAPSPVVTPRENLNAQAIPLLEKPPGWILSDSTWKAFDRSVVKLDFGTAGGETYIGMRLVLPFGER